ncbi:MAG: TIGR03084 family metal-binding protein [Pseudomonadota bacterium]
MEQVDDFVAESEALHALIADLPSDAFATETAFKRWTVDQILQHLHYFNRMAVLSLTQPDAFRAEYARFAEGRKADGSMLGITNRLLGGLSGPQLRDAWLAQVRDIEAPFRAADPKARVPWAGPDMSVRSAITARLMETWAHGQAIWDVLGRRRKDTDSIRNIAHLGVATFGWSFRNRGEPVPDKMPHVSLDAPSGATWEWGEPNADERVTGPATDFCQVVAQTRNIADVGLTVTGPVAARWMAIAQCFAGPPEDPPAPGTRITAGASAPR